MKNQNFNSKPPDPFSPCLITPRYLFWGSDDSFLFFATFSLSFWTFSPLFRLQLSVAFELFKTWTIYLVELNEIYRLMILASPNSKLSGKHQHQRVDRFYGPSRPRRARDADCGWKCGTRCNLRRRNGWKIPTQQPLRNPPIFGVPPTCSPVLHAEREARPIASFLPCLKTSNPPVGYSRCRHRLCHHSPTLTREKRTIFVAPPSCFELGIKN